MPELDATDRAIVTLLREDGRLPAAAIAEKVGLSRPAVADRIDKLTRAGVIVGFTAVIDPDMVGHSITAFISARPQGVTSPRAEKALRDLAGLREILEIHSVAGDDCLLIKVRTESIGTLNEIVSMLAAPPFEMTTRTTIAMETLFEKVGGVMQRSKDEPKPARRRSR